MKQDDNPSPFMGSMQERTCIVNDGFTCGVWRPALTRVSDSFIAI